VLPSNSGIIKVAGLPILPIKNGIVSALDSSGIWVHSVPEKQRKILLG
jgi:hypothetical protein